MWKKLLNFLAVVETIKASEISCSSFITAVVHPKITIDYISTESTLSIRMSTSEKGYIGFGISDDGKMLGSEAVIGRIPNDVAKYNMGADSVAIMDEDNQTLKNTSFVQDESGSVLQFTKLLIDGNGKIIKGNNFNRFIWAVGGDNSFIYHIAKGVFQLKLSPCEDDDGSGISTVIIEETKSYKFFFAVHGILAIVAFGLLMPIAIVASRVRNLLKGKAWFLVHSWLNSLSYLLTCVLFGLVVYTYIKRGSKHFKNAHEIVGLIVFVLLTIQVVAGILRPNAPPPRIVKVTIDTEANIDKEQMKEIGTSNTEAKINKEEGVNKNTKVTGFADNPSTKKEGERKETQVAMRRIIWKKSHAFMGVTSFGCAIFQLHSGVSLYEDIYGSDGYVKYLWTLLGCIFSVLTTLMMYSKYTQRRKSFVQGAT